MTTPLRLARLDDDELAIADQLTKQLSVKRSKHRRNRELYEGRHRFRQLSIAVPPALQDIDTALGWPAMAVDALNERLRVERVVAVGDSSDTLGLGEVWDDNNLTVELSFGVLDSLLFGCGFIVGSAGTAGEPETLITVEPATRMTGSYSRRARRLTAALSIDTVDAFGLVNERTLFLPNSTTIIDHRGRILDRRVHNLGRVPVERLVNRERSERPWGDSEITRPIRNLTAGAVRTLLGSEVAREFFSSPQRWIIGATEDQFERKDGSAVSPWEAYIGRWLTLPGADADGPSPQVGTFAASSPEPYIAQARMYAQLFAGEAAIPVGYTGLAPDSNPASADAIRQVENRLVMRAENRQLGFGRSIANAAGRLALLIRDGKVPDGLRLHTVWMDAATPTKAATTDAVTKQISSGVYTDAPEVALEDLGWSAEKIARVLAERRKAAGAALLPALLAAPPAPETTAPPAQPAA